MMMIFGEEIHNKEDDFLMFVILEEHKKSCRNTEIRTENFIEGIGPQMLDLFFSAAFQTFQDRWPKKLLLSFWETARPTAEIEKQHEHSTISAITQRMKERISLNLLMMMLITWLIFLFMMRMLCESEQKSWT